MIAGEITSRTSDGYGLTLANGQSLQLQDKYLPESIRAVGQKVNLIFGGVESSGVSAGEARALINNLLSFDVRHYESRTGPALR